MICTLPVVTIEIKFYPE